MTNCWFILSIILSVGWISAEDLRLLDLPPPEAEQYINSKDQTLKYAPKIESNVPAVRVLGDTPTNVVEDIYLANQYHGQDGLGSYLYGYSVPDIAKTEKKKAHGDLKGAYQYINGGGQEIKVQYWDDGTGFHQIDNLPEVLPKQVEDSPDVQAAKQEFFKRWHEEAERNTHPVAPSGPGVGQQGGQQQYQPPQSQGSYGVGQQPLAGQIGSNQEGQGSYGVGQQAFPSQIGSNQQGQGSYGIGQNPLANQIGSNQGQYQQGQGSYGIGQNPLANQIGSNQGQYLQGQGSYGVGQQKLPSQTGSNQGSYGGYQTGQLGQQGQFAGHPSHGGTQSSQTSSQTVGQIGQGGYPSGQVATGSGQYTQGGQLGQGGYQSSQSGYQSGPGQTCCGGQYSNSQESYAQNQGNNEWEYKPSEEEKGPPRGFFYNVDYPVGIIVQKQGVGGVHKRESLGEVYAENKANFDRQVKNGASPDGSTQNGYQVHV